MGNAEMGKQESFARPGMALLARFVASLSLSPPLHRTPIQ